MRIGRGRSKRHFRAEIIPALFAACAAAAGKAGLERDAVARLEPADGGADLGYGSRGLVADYEGLAGEDGVGADGAVGPPVDLGAISWVVVESITTADEDDESWHAPRRNGAIWNEVK